MSTGDTAMGTLVNSIQLGIHWQPGVTFRQAHSYGFVALNRLFASGVALDEWGVYAFAACQRVFLPVSEYDKDK